MDLDPQLHYTPLAIPYSISILLLMGLTYLGAKQRQTPVTQAYLWFAVCLLAWTVSGLLELLTLNLKLVTIASHMESSCVVFMPIIWLWLALSYSNNHRTFRRFAPWLLVIPTVTLIIIWTNPLHQLWVVSVTQDLTTTWFPIITYDSGMWYYAVHIPYSYALTFTGIGILVRLFLMQKSVYRWQSVSLIVALLIPLSVEIAHQFGIQPIDGYNIAPLLFPISCGIMAWSVLGYQFLNVNPIARHFVVENMSDLMIVLDHQGRIADMNPAARKILFHDRPPKFGSTMDELFPKDDQLLTISTNRPREVDHMTIHQNGQHQVYDVKISPLAYSTGQNAGVVLLMQDITQKLQAEYDHHQTLTQSAVDTERERVARELHDSVNQLLFSASTIADLLPKAIDKKPEKVPEYVAEIQQLLHSATAEMCLILLELYPDAITETDLSTLIKYLSDAFKGITGATVHTHTPSVIKLDPAVQMVFYRITQESLQNIQKHAQATTITIRLARQDEYVVLSIQDNGVGFDTITQHSSHRFGLNNMRQRAHSINATLDITSIIHHGTHITLKWSVL